MGGIQKLLFLTLTIVTGYVAFVLHGIFKDDPVPLIKDEYWGPSSQSNLKEDESIRPFKIDISQSILKDLNERLKIELNSNRFASPLEGVGFEYGFNTEYLKVISQYWMEKYNWTERQSYLNRHSHFKTKVGVVGGIDLHFQHIKPNGVKNFKKSLPLMFIHGWPGSFVEYQKIVEFFLQPENSDFNFELIIPSLPGYGFSSPAARPGMSPLIIANILFRLMDRLGYQKYYVLGEDFGTLIASDMAILYPERVKGLHIGCVSMHPRDLLKGSIINTVYPSSVMTPRDMERYHPPSKGFAYSMQELGFFHIQATKPDTIGVSVSNSPSGLAAYILEKFSTWTNREYISLKDGGLTKKFTLDELLDNVMIYWVTGSITSSMRLYAEEFSSWNKYPTFRVPVKSPTACIVAREELSFASEVTLSSKLHDLRQMTVASKGGHFTSYEEPQSVAIPAIKFFNEMEHLVKNV